MTRVVDASTVVAALTDSGADGRWAESQLASGPLIAPHLLMVEVAHVLRRGEQTRQLSVDVAAISFATLQQLPIELSPFELVAARVWELRANVSAYDATYVALAELLGVPLATLDARLANAPGPRCEFALPT